ncbi:hypothetical protein K438DRAFT_1817544 [Mycena galopus ATCC 62051]|nr:hypothetical protein K438DRAFT_1817544 [Mycena galopus ATCC 62051]
MQTSRVDDIAQRRCLAVFLLFPHLLLFLYRQPGAHRLSSALMSSLSAPSLPAADSDAQILKLFGRNILQDAAGIIIQSILCSAYDILFMFARYSILRRGLRSRGSTIMFSVVVYLYAASVAEWSLDVSAGLKAVYSLLMVPDMPIPDREALAAKNTASLSTPGIIIQMIIGDAVVIWRTWIIYQRRCFAILIPCLLLLVSFVFVIMGIFCMTGSSSFPGAEGICPHTPLVSRHRKIVRGLNLTGKTYPMSTEKILALLVESGFICCLLWLSQIIIYLNITRDSPWYYVLQVVRVMSNQIAGMYPTLIIVIVNFHRTIWEDAPFEPPLRNNNGVMEWAWGLKRSGPTDTFGTQSGVNVRVETVVHGDSESTLGQFPSEDVCYTR